MKIQFLLIVALTFAFAHPAAAYIGPGTGVGALGTVIALVAAIGLLIVGFVWFPVKRMLRKRENPEEPGSAETTMAEDAELNAAAKADSEQ